MRVGDGIAEIEGKGEEIVDVGTMGEEELDEGRKGICVRGISEDESGKV